MDNNDLRKRVEAFARQTHQELGVTDFVTLFHQMAKEMKEFANDVEVADKEIQEAYDASLEFEAKWIKENR